MSDPVRTPLQFGLRGLLALTGVASFLFALSNWIGPCPAIGLAFFLLLIAVHVAANASGGRHFDPPRPGLARLDPTAESHPLDAAPETAQTVAQMQAEAVERIGRIRLGWATALGTLAGAVAGGIAGHAIGQASFDLTKPNAMNGLVIAAVSAGVLGGFLGFWCSSFLQIFLAMNAAGWEGARKKWQGRPRGRE